MMNLANILTLARLILLPFIVVLFFIPAKWAAFACLTLYAIGAITDFLDGWVARKYNQITEFGTFIDPISDKIFVVVITLMLVAADHVQGIWVIPLLIILIREFLVSGMREFLGPKNIKLPVTKLAKWKTTVQMVAMGLLILAPYYTLAAISGLIALVIAAVLTVQTGWAYLTTGFKHMDQ
jgi:CDP-diacylglycerol--glycerol-3-phosphate 3-phosphatidyltransferase